MATMNAQLEPKCICPICFRYWKACQYCVDTHSGQLAIGVDPEQSLTVRLYQAHDDVCLRCRKPINLCKQLVGLTEQCHKRGKRRIDTFPAWYSQVQLEMYLRQSKDFPCQK